MKTPQAPQFLNDVYRDLRDRHLLIPAVVLLVALIAVPMLLKSTSDPVVPPPPVTADKQVAETVPAVLAATDVSVRDYRQRLDDLKSKNPFEQQFQDSEEAATTTDGTTTPGEVDPAAPGAGLTGGTGSTVPSDAAAPPAGLNTGSDTPSPGDVDVVTHLYTHRVDLQVGVQGDLKNRNRVRPMTILPSEDNPVLAFLGTNEEGTRAAFVIASDATPNGGDGYACVPTDANCLYITLEKGESVTLFYAPDGQTYELVLKDIKKVKL
jgi:hypothetical protein